VEVEPRVETLLLEMEEEGVRGCRAVAVELLVFRWGFLEEEDVPKRASRLAELLLERVVDLEEDVPKRASRLEA